VAARDEIIAFCDELLDAAAFGDYCPNGLQVPGATEVRKIATGVSAHLDLLERARDADAQLVLAHHGLFWDSQPRALSEPMAARLRMTLEAGLSVAGYHLPLDAHPGIGNNALLCRQLGFEATAEAFAETRGRPIGTIGRRESPLAAAALFSAVQEAAGREPLVFASGPAEVRSIGIVTGGGAGYLHEAIGRGLDALVTGEASEPAMADAREGGLHFIAAGHYATETFGIRCLGELVAEEFEVDHEFIDIPNPV
jgi:dinuclear metal center YbgI/SA1388 family protein